VSSTPTVSTLAQLLALFLDNTSGEISALDGRSLIVTVFGYLGTTDPTPLNDRADTAGIGAFFDAGSRWTNLTTKQTWVCLSGSVGTAQWEGQVHNTQILGGRLYGPAYAPVLAPSGVIAGSYGDGAHYSTFTVAADGTLSAAGQVSISIPASTVVAAGSGIGVSFDGIHTYTVSLTSPIALSAVPSLPASQITSGTFSTSQIPSLPASQITSGTFSTSLLPSSWGGIGSGSPQGVSDCSMLSASFAASFGIAGSNCGLASLLTFGNTYTSVITAIPILSLRGETISAIGVQLDGASGGTVQFGIYEAISAPGNIYPGALVAGSFASMPVTVTTGQQFYTYSTPVTLTPGKLYYLAFQCSASTVVVAGVNCNAEPFAMTPLGYINTGFYPGAYFGFQDANTYVVGSMPASFPGTPTTTTALTGIVPAILYKIFA
jgi:hypothetical protein